LRPRDAAIFHGTFSVLGPLQLLLDIYEAQAILSDFFAAAQSRR
jgi:hypothetical protein